MKIVTWNVRGKNRRIPMLIRHALETHPDVVCLQEVPFRFLPFLETIPGYTTTKTLDFDSKKSKHKRYTCILSTQQPTKVQEVLLAHHVKLSLWNRFAYRFIKGMKECHQAIVIEIPMPQGLVRLVSTRLSAAVGTIERIRQLQILFDSFDTTCTTIICGDLNIMDNRILNMLTGWARGFRLADYFKNERRLFDLLCREKQFTNIFSGISTWIINHPLLQPDHILIPNTVRVRHQETSRRFYGSDHRMLLADLEV